MLMCSRCKKRPAVVFISQMNAKDPQHKKNEGLCLVCAKELGISQVDDYMKAMGISDDDLEAMSNQLMEASDGDDFEPGGTNFLSNLFGGDAANLFGTFCPKEPGLGRLPNKHFCGPAAQQKFRVWPHPNCLPFVRSPKNKAKHY